MAEKATVRRFNCFTKVLSCLLIVALTVTGVTLLIWWTRPPCAIVTWRRLEPDGAALMDYINTGGLIYRGLFKLAVLDKDGEMRVEYFDKDTLIAWIRNDESHAYKRIAFGTTKKGWIDPCIVVLDPESGSVLSVRLDEKPLSLALVAQSWPNVVLDNSSEINCFYGNNRFTSEDNISFGQQITLDENLRRIPKAHITNEGEIIAVGKDRELIMFNADGKLQWTDDRCRVDDFLVSQDRRIYTSSWKELQCRGFDGNVLWSFSPPQLPPRLFYEAPSGIESIWLLDNPLYSLLVVGTYELYWLDKQGRVIYSVHLNGCLNDSFNCKSFLGLDDTIYLQESVLSRAGIIKGYKDSQNLPLSAADYYAMWPNRIEQFASGGNRIGNWRLPKGVEIKCGPGPEGEFYGVQTEFDPATLAQTEYVCRIELPR